MLIGCTILVEQDVDRISSALGYWGKKQPAQERDGDLDR